MHIWKKNETACIFINYVVFCSVHVYFRIKKFKNLLETLIFGTLANYQAAFFVSTCMYCIMYGTNKGTVFYRSY